MTKQISPLKPKVSMFSKPNFFKSNSSQGTIGNSNTPKFDKSNLPKAPVIVTQHKGGS